MSSSEGLPDARYYLFPCERVKLIQGIRAPAFSKEG